MFWGVLLLLGIAALAIFGIVSVYAYQWATTGSAWFTVLDHRFHKVSFLVGTIFGALVLGGGGGAANRD